MALALKMDGKPQQVYCLTGDGELQEGNIWESLLFAGKNKMDNLTVVVDRNNIQIDGFTEDVMPLDPLRSKFEAFRWNVIEVDGHNIREFIAAIQKAHAVHQQPTAIIARTIPGKGVGFMENKFEWHGKPPTKEEARIALEELRTLQGKIEAGN